ncbi:MAG TPA: NAD(+)/NADH kinase [Haliangiales bacterium]|nr:NAD(+)/NADH kinase [Haliangiales bacterium]
MTDNIQRVGLIANPEKGNCLPAVQKAAALIAKAGRLVLSDQATADLAGLKTTSSRDARDLTEQVDLILVFGGDGTMLRVAREVAGSRTPILGINVGGLGFLTAVSSDQLPNALAGVWSGEFTVETRSLIEAGGQIRDRTLRQTALNDFVISRGTVTRLIELEVRVDDAVLTHYRCDGLIVSSPTGSTAYSLAAGGAIVSPNAEVFALTPICPHTLSNRSVIVSLDSVVQVTVLSRKVETILSADGQVQMQLTAGDSIAIRRSQRAVRLLRPGGSSFFETLRQKLHWSGSNI